MHAVCAMPWSARGCVTHGDCSTNAIPRVDLAALTTIEAARPARQPSLRGRTARPRGAMTTNARLTGAGRARRHRIGPRGGRAPGRHRVGDLLRARQPQRRNRCPAGGSTRPRCPADTGRPPLRRVRATDSRIARGSRPGGRGEADPEHGSIRLAAVTTAGELLIPALLASFTAKYPGVDCKLEVASRNAIWPMLARHEVDVVVAGRPPADLSQSGCAQSLEHARGGRAAGHRASFRPGAGDMATA